MRGGVLRVLEQFAQRRAFGEIAGLHDDQRIARRRGKKALEELGVRIACAPDPHHAPPAQSSEMAGRFVGKPRRIAIERVAVEFGDAERIGQIGHHGSRQRVGALAHQTLVGAEHQRRHQRLRRPGRKGVASVVLDFMALRIVVARRPSVRASPARAGSGRARRMSAASRR